MSRPYRLGKRADAMAQTRARIVQAAADAYAEQGIRRTSIQEVARRASLSPATVLNHFPTSEALWEEVIAHLTASLDVPTSAVFEDVRDVPTRVERLAVALALFYERSEPLYRIHAAERDTVPALARAEARFYRDLDALVREALGRYGRREPLVQAILAIASPGVFGQIRAGGRGARAAGEMVGGILATWLARETGGKR